MPDAVPIDLSPWFDGDEDARDQVAARVDEACRTVGFLAVTGHRIDPDLVDEMLADGKLTRAELKRFEAELLADGQLSIDERRHDSVTARWRDPHARVSARLHIGATAGQQDQ